MSQELAKLKAPPSKQSETAAASITKIKTMSEASQGINIDTMSLDQLNSLKQQQENRLQSLSAQYNAFKDAKDRLNIAKESLSTIPTNGEGGQEIMIPLTESLYAPGKIVSPNEILVELGAGSFHKCY